MALNYGSIHIERGTGNAMQFYGAWEFDWKFNGVTITNFPGDTRISYDMEQIERYIYIVNTLFKTTADAELFLSTLKTAQAAGTLTLELQVEAADYFEVDGTNTSTEVYCRQITRFRRISHGYPSTSVYEVPMIIFQEA